MKKNDTLAPIDALSPISIDLDASRRSFFKSVGMGAVGAAVLGAASGSFTEAYAQSIGDADILNFALNLEYLEAQFYLRAVTGQGLSASDMGANPGSVAGGKQVPFASPIINAYAAEIAAEERTHVQFLRSALGSAAVSQPNIDLLNSFTVAARAAGVINPDPNSGSYFNPFDNDTNFLIGSYIFEDVGVTAYKGAAALLQNKAYLTAAAGILAVEAYHAGSIRTALFAQQNASVVSITAKISALRSSLANNGNQNADDTGIGTNGSPHIVVADSNAIAYSRTTSQVLNIVYGRQNAPGTGGLFFPSGMNGRIR